MKPKPQGNGSGKIDIHQQDMGGLVRVFTDKTHAHNEELPIFLALALTEWFRQRPQLRLRTVTSVARDGYTCELLCWYEMHLFPNLTQQTPAPKS
jgi:hypothetical protein